MHITMTMIFVRSLRISHTDSISTFHLQLHAFFSVTIATMWRQPHAVSVFSLFSGCLCSEAASDQTRGIPQRRLAEAVQCRPVLSAGLQLPSSGEAMTLQPSYSGVEFIFVGKIFIAPPSPYKYKV